MSSLNRKLRNQDGFTLLEVILSIGALAVLSVFILQMFIVSANANKRAQDMDVASAMAISELDRLSLANSYEEYCQGKLILPVGSSLTEERVLSATYNLDALYGSLVVIYDGNWQDITELFSTADSIDLTETDTRYVMSIDAQKNGAEDLAGELLDITVTVQSVNNMTTVYSSDKSTTRTLVEYSTSKYFPAEADVLLSYEDTANFEADDVAVASVLVELELDKISSVSSYDDYASISGALKSSNYESSPDVSPSSTTIYTPNSSPAPILVEDKTLIIVYDREWQNITESFEDLYNPEDDIFSGTDAYYALYVDLLNDSQDDGKSIITVSVKSIESSEVLAAASTVKYQAVDL